MSVPETQILTTMAEATTILSKLLTYSQHSCFVGAVTNIGNTLNSHNIFWVYMKTRGLGMGLTVSEKELYFSKHTVQFYYSCFQN